MVSDAFRGAHVTTGSIIFDHGQKNYYLCTTPACDLVPGRQQKPSFLHVAKLTQQSGDGKNTPGERIMFEHGSRTVTARVLHADTKQSDLHHILLPDGTAIQKDDEGRYKLSSIFLKDMDWTIDAEAENSPNVTAKVVDLEIVAQLRRGFAERYLNEAGKQLSRIGVDFVDL